ncbi:MAG: zinc ribbon domain-containing protein [Butyrivibrio sp.]|nr:zinc ribbon domain-containing protein [Butyrivibrio sp.]
MNETGRKPAVTAKNIIRVLSVIVIIIFFCPTFLVSCSGQTIDVSAMNVVGGIKSYGESVVKPQPLLLICLLLPIAIFVILFLNKKFTDDKAALITAICAAVDLIVWIIFRVQAKKAALKNYCTFKVTGWYVFNIIFLICIIALAVLVLFRVIHMQEDLVVRFRGSGAQDALNQMASAVKGLAENVSANVGNGGVPKEDIMGYCAKCGTPLIFGDKFCTSCGRPVPEDIIAEAEEERRAAEEARRAAEEARRAEEEARRAAEEAARREAEERARREAEERAKREAEERARREAEAEARRAEAEARRAEEAARREEEAARRAEEVRVETDELTEKELSKLAYGSSPRPAFCSRCGAKLASDAVFCSACGTKIV